jgi:iron complex outermembrane receptor protein
MSRFGLPCFVAAVLGAAPFATAFGQQATPETTTPAQTELEEVIVTGSTHEQTILETSFAISTIDEAQLAQSPSLGTAALLDQVPGLWAEANGGEVNTNVSPRGLRGGFFTYVSLQEDGLPVMYNGFFPEFEVRRDLSYGRVEVTRGGPSGVLTSNGAAAIVNFLSRMPTERVEGEAQVSYTDYGSIRTDLFYGGPLPGTNNWFATVGGYYRRGDGIKDVGYLADHGGQIRANLMRTFDAGSVTIGFKHIDDHTTFFTPQPVALLPNGTATEIAGFSATNDYLAGPETRLLGIKSPTGRDETVDLGDGESSKTDQLTVRLDYDLGSGFSVRDSLRVAKIDQVSRDLRGLANSSIFPATTFLASDPRVAGLISAYAADGAVAARLQHATTGQAITSPGSLNGNGLLVQQVNNVFSQKMDQLINDLRLTFETERNSATLGLLSWDVSMDVRQIANTFLLDVTNNAHLIDVVAVNAAGNVVGSLTDRGVLQYGTGGSYGNGTVDIRSNSLYFNDQMQLTDRLRIDAGVRYEYVRNQSSAEDQTSGATLAGAFDSDGNDVNNVLADNFGGSFGAGTYTFGENHLDDVAWTLGGNYQFTDSFAVYARYADAFDTGIANFGVFCAGNPAACFPSKTTELKFAELGVRFSFATFYAQLTAFQSKNANVAVLVGTAGDSVPVDNEANGVEFDMSWRPVDAFGVQLSGVIQKSELKSVGVSGGASFDGNQLDRLPNEQIKLTPTWYFADGRGQMYVTGAYYSKRFGDLANTLEFDSYTDLSAGISVSVSDKFLVSLQGTNLTDEFALSAGNPRGNSIIAGQNAFGFAHAILPRALRFSIDARF